MQDENVEQTEAQKNEEVESTTQDDNGEEVLTKEQIAELKSKAEVSSQNFERAKKAEAELKKLQGSKKEEIPGTDASISPKDYLALNENKISSEDFDEVVRIAKILNKPISEALKDSTLKRIISDRVEERQTAQATQTRSPRGTTKATGDSLIEKASQGFVPEKDADIEELVNARMAQKLKR